MPATATSVADTWRLSGWRPVTDEERKERLRRAMVLLFDGGPAEAMEPVAPAAAIRPLA